MRNLLQAMAPSRKVSCLNCARSGIRNVPSFTITWVKAWRRESSPKPVRTLQPWRYLFASWAGVWGSLFLAGVVTVKRQWGWYESCNAVVLPLLHSWSSHVHMCAISAHSLCQLNNNFVTKRAIDLSLAIHV